MPKALLSLCLLGLALATPTWADEAQEITFERPDGAVLYGSFHLAGNEASRQPAVLLLHQAQSSRAEFDFLLADLHALGFHTLAVDLRGHGKSSKPKKLDNAFFMKLFRDPDFAPPDVQAMLQWLAQHPQVDARRIAAMGGSVGANLSFVANGAGWQIQTSVVLSGNAEAAVDLTGDISPFQPRNVLLLAADNDHGRDDYARQMFARAEEPKRLEIVEGSAHGAALLQEDPKLKQLVLDWLAEQLAANGR